MVGRRRGEKEKKRKGEKWIEIKEGVEKRKNGEEGIEEIREKVAICKK